VPVEKGRSKSVKETGGLRDQLAGPGGKTAEEKSQGREGEKHASCLAYLWVTSGEENLRASLAVC